MCDSTAISRKPANRNKLGGAAHLNTTPCPTAEGWSGDKQGPAPACPRHSLCWCDKSQTFSGFMSRNGRLRQEPCQQVRQGARGLTHYHLCIPLLPRDSCLDQGGHGSLFLGLGSLMPRGLPLCGRPACVFTAALRMCHLGMGSMWRSIQKGLMPQCSPPAWKATWSPGTPWPHLSRATLSLARILQAVTP